MMIYGFLLVVLFTINPGFPLSAGSDRPFCSVGLLSVRFYSISGRGFMGDKYKKFCFNPSIPKPNTLKTAI